MQVKLHQRQQLEPGGAGGQPVEGAGTFEMAQAQAYQQLGQAARELAVRSQAAQRQTDVSMRVLAARGAYESWWQQRSQQVALFDTLDTDADEKLREIFEQQMRGVQSDPLSQAALTKEMFEFATTKGIEARKTKITQQVDWARSKLFTNTGTRRQEIAARADPFEKNRIKHEGLEDFRMMAAVGVISPLEAEKQAREFLDGIAEDALNLLVYKEPDDVLKDIYAGVYSNLSEPTRQRIIINAEKRSEALRQQSIAAARRTQVVEEKNRELAQDYHFGNLHDGVKHGRVSKAELRAALDGRTIRASQFRQLYDAAEIIERAGGIGNPALRDEAMREAYRGNLRPAHLLNMAGELNNDELAQVQSVVNAGTAVTQSELYKQQARFIDAQLGGTLKIGFGGSIDMQRTASMALQEFYQRAATNPDADLQQVSYEIVRKYDQTSMVTRRQTPVRRSKFKTYAELVLALQNGTITEEEFNSLAFVMERFPDREEQR